MCVVLAYLPTSFFGLRFVAFGWPESKPDLMTNMIKTYQNDHLWQPPEYHGVNTHVKPGWNMLKQHHVKLLNHVLTKQHELWQLHGIKMAFTLHLAELKHLKICSKPMDLLPLPRLQAPHLVVVIDHLVKFWHCHIGKTNIYMGLKSLFCVYIYMKIYVT
jgi:hypothetical protein